MSQVNAAGGYSAQFSQFVSFAEDRVSGDVGAGAGQADLSNCSLKPSISVMAD